MNAISGAVIARIRGTSGTPIVGGDRVGAPTTRALQLGVVGVDLDVGPAEAAAYGHDGVPAAPVEAGACTAVEPDDDGVFGDAVVQRPEQAAYVDGAPGTKAVPGRWDAGSGHHGSLIPEV